MTAFRNLAEKSKVAFSDKYMLGFVNLLTTEVPTEEDTSYMPVFAEKDDQKCTEKQHHY